MCAFLASFKTFCIVNGCVYRPTHIHTYTHMQTESMLPEAWIVVTLASREDFNWKGAEGVFGGCQHCFCFAYIGVFIL